MTKLSTAVAPLVPPDTSRLPSFLFLGTSSWTHKFWKGQIYHREYSSEKDFNLNCLKEYADLGLFRAVEIDSTFYLPPKEETLAHYAELVPSEFRFTAKVWERISIHTYPPIKRYGKRAGQLNPGFLDPMIFSEEFLPPFRNRSFHAKLGSFLIQFPKFDRHFLNADLFLVKLEEFLANFPSEFPLAIEIRNRELLSKEYVELLNRYGVSHCFNQWDSMHSLLDQMKLIASWGGLEARFYSARLVSPLGVSFDQAGKMFEPFSHIVKRDELARRAMKVLARRAHEKGIPAYIIVNNRFEGNSPETVSELIGELSEETPPSFRS